MDAIGQPAVFIPLLTLGFALYSGVPLLWQVVNTRGDGPNAWLTAVWAWCVVAFVFSMGWIG